MSKQLWFSFKLALVLAALLACALSVHGQSLWKQDIYRPMTADKRATSIGDVLTIVIQESNSASKDNSTTTSKKSSIDAAIQAFLYSPDASKLLTKNGALPSMKMNGSQDFAGSGKIANNETVTARIAVRVVDVLPNRTLVIEGTRQIAFAGETQDAVLRGVVRIEDIASNNTIFSYNIADATIRYISKGTVSDNQRKGWFMKAWEKLTPF